jgi:hypothetical protein
MKWLLLLRRRLKLYRNKLKFNPRLNLRKRFKSQRSLSLSQSKIKTYVNLQDVEMSSWTTQSSAGSVALAARLFVNVETFLWMMLTSVGFVAPLVP